MTTKSIADLVSWVATIAAFVFACIGIFSQPVVLQSPRPKQSITQEQQANPSGQVTARRISELWDDPFAVFKPVMNWPATARRPRHNTRALLLVILTNTGRYQSDSEQRLRRRYAVESAIRDSSFTPENPGELTEVPVHLEIDPSTIWSPALTMEVPTESFRRRPARPLATGPEPFCFLSVAWLPERLIPESILANLCTFCKNHVTELAPGLADADICVLGPTNSDALASICNRETRAPDSRLVGKPVQYPRILNYQATAADPLVRMFALQEKDSDSYARSSDDEIISTISGGRAGASKKHLISNDGVPIERVGVDDFELCQRLVGEIRKRTKTTGLGKPRILLVAESDTLYGRAAAHAFRLAAAGTQTKDLPHAAIEQREVTEFDIDHFYYMRGLDGSSTLYDSQYFSVPSSSNQRQTRIETAEGVSQFDYIRRLSEYVRQPGSILSATFREPDAIVLLGTDVYDKLTLLKLLRERFQHSLYLTTDLDALYWHPEYVRDTRNLIVAASFPLDVFDVAFSKQVRNEEDIKRELAAGVPANKLITVNHFRRLIFRDSYQTALYNATLLAVTASRAQKWQRQTYLFEIGNTRAVQLDEPGWAALTKTEFWEDYLQGVSSLPSLALQTLLVVVAVSFLLLLRRVKFELRLFPDEFFTNLQLRAPDELRELIDEFAKLVKKTTIWSSGPIPSSKKLIEILREVRSQAGEVKQLSRDPGLSVSYELRRLAAAITKLRSHFQQQDIRSAGGVSRWTKGIWRLLHLRRLRLKPWWTAGLIAPLVAPPVAGDSDFDPEIQEFLRYANPKSFAKTTVYKLIVLAAMVSLGIYFLLNPNFEGIVGPELREGGLRWFRIIISLIGFGLILAVVVWTCSEQWRCRELVRNLLKVVGERSALVDRQIISVVAAKSNEVANLAWKPCVLLFLFYVAHLRVFVGPPFDFCHWLLFGSLLLTVCVFFFLLSTTASEARRRVLSEYEQEILTAKRLDARFASIIKDNLPVQDDLKSTLSLFHGFAFASSSVIPVSDPKKVVADDLKIDTTLKSIRDYLEAVVTRDEKILDIVSELRSGAFAPFAISSLLGALLVPIGGAGGLTLLDFILRQVM